MQKIPILYGPRNGTSVKFLFTSYSTYSGGVAILFNNNFTFQLQRSFLDNTGRFIICDIETNEKLITLATICAPNEDDPGLFERFHDHLRDFQCDDIIMGGAFNLVLDIDIDKKGSLAKTHAKAVKVIKDHMAELDLMTQKNLLQVLCRIWNSLALYLA